MPRITQELLRKRAEHNDMCLITLEEVTLHQYELEKIENLDVYCRHLKILYLQNNIIEKMENLNKLKELEYLNLALNNISIIEGIDGCESLKKLDLTVNFVDLEDLEESSMNVKRCESLRELYLTGNPCTDWSGYRDFVIATADQLDVLDSKDITPTEKIKAKQKYDDLLIDLYHQIQMKKIKKEQEEIKRKAEEELKKQQPQEKVNPEDEKKPYTKEVRREMYLEQAKQREQKEQEKNPKQPEKKETPMYRDNGEIRQCNEGKYGFKLREWDDVNKTFFDLEIPKYLDTSQVDVNINPKWVSIRIKGKLTQLKLNEEIIVDKSIIQRSQITGILSITMFKIHPNEFIQYDLQQEKQLAQQKLEEKLKKEEAQKKMHQDNLQLCSKIEEKLVLKKPTSENHTLLDDVPDLE